MILTEPNEYHVIKMNIVAQGFHQDARGESFDTRKCGTSFYAELVKP